MFADPVYVNTPKERQTVNQTEIVVDVQRTSH